MRFALPIIGICLGVAAIVMLLATWPPTPAPREVPVPLVVLTATPSH